MKTTLNTQHTGDTTKAANRLADGGPIRTCVGCGGRASQSTLIRIAAVQDGTVVWDELRRAPGRGAYLHPNRNCLERAEKRHAIERALKLKHPAPATMTQIVQEVARRLEGKCDDHGENSRLRTG